MGATCTTGLLSFSSSVFTSPIAFMIDFQHSAHLLVCLFHIFIHYPNQIFDFELSNFFFFFQFPIDSICIIISSNDAAGLCKAHFQNLFVLLKNPIAFPLVIFRLQIYLSQSLHIGCHLDSIEHFRLFHLGNLS